MFENVTNENKKQFLSDQFYIFETNVFVSLFFMTNFQERTKVGVAVHSARSQTAAPHRAPSVSAMGCVVLGTEKVDTCRRTCGPAVETSNPPLHIHSVVRPCGATTMVDTVFSAP